MLHPISLADIRKHGPCKDGWDKLLAGLGNPHRKTWAATMVTLGDVAVINGAADAWWCVRVLPEAARRDVIRALLPSVERAALHTTDKRVHDCIATVRAWVTGKATDGDVRAAAEAAWAAWAAAEAWADERERQTGDIIAVFGRAHVRAAA